MLYDCSSNPSNHQFLQSFTPKPLNKFHSFSNDQPSLSHATCPEYELRNASDSSSSNSSIGIAHRGEDLQLSNHHGEQSSGYGAALLGDQFDGSISGSSRQASYSCSSARHSDDAIMDSYLLVPHISITPEMCTAYSGQESMWVAIELSGQLSRPSVSDDVYGAPGSNNLFMPVHHSGAGLSRYGYLYDINIDILPTAHSSILEVIDYGTSRYEKHTGMLGHLQGTSILTLVVRMLHPGSSILILVKIQLDASQLPQPGGKRKHEPDDLFADLEFQLGSVKTEYTKVRLTYCHSGFPMLADVSTMSSTSSSQTRLETTATGVIERQSPVSIWSPGPVPASNALFPIIASHWGPIRAHDVMNKITMVPRSSSPRKLARGNNKSMICIGGAGSDPKTPDKAARAPRAPQVQVPRRQASLGKQFLALGHDGEDPARRIWTEMRRRSSGRDPSPSLHANKSRRAPANRSTIPDTGFPRNAVATLSRSRNEVIERRRQQLRDTALRNKRSIGADSLRSLVPSLANFHLDSRDEAESDTSDRTQHEVHAHPVLQKNNEGRWKFGSWW